MMYLSTTGPRAVRALAVPSRWRRGSTAAAASSLQGTTQSARLLSSAAATRNGESSTTSYSQAPPQLPPVLPSPSAAATASPAGQRAASATAPPQQKSAFQRLWDRYSIRGQQHRSQLAEAYFQAATRRASDPYVQRKRNLGGGWRILFCISFVAYLTLPHFSSLSFPLCSALPYRILYHIHTILASRRAFGSLMTHLTASGTDRDGWGGSSVRGTPC
jgi:hypothetical protein